MIRPISLSRIILPVILMTFSLSYDSSAYAATAIVRANLDFSSETGMGSRRVSIILPDKGTRYSLSLDPDFDVKHHVISLALVLQHLGDEVDAPNLLDPTGKSHGYQKYIFAASDFVRGARQSLHGERRTIFLDRLGLVLQIHVSKVGVTAIPGSSEGDFRYQFNELGLQVQVESIAPPRK